MFFFRIYISEYISYPYMIIVIFITIIYIIYMSHTHIYVIMKYILIDIFVYKIVRLNVFITNHTKM